MCFGLSEIESDILSRRFSQAPETLEQISKTYGLTRERIRQLQVQGVRSVQRSSGYRNSREAAALSMKMKGYLTRETTSRCVHHVYPNSNSNVSAAVGAIVFDDLKRGNSNLYGGAMIRDRQIRLAAEDIQEAVNEAAIAHPICTVDQVVAMVKADPRYTMESSWVKEIVSDLWSVFRSNAEDRLTELRRNATAANLARDVIQEAGQALHWAVVGDEVNLRRERLGLRALSERGTHNRLQSMKSLFSYAGQGTYGLRAWGDDVPYIRSLIAEVLESAGKPLTIIEIGNESSKRRHVKEASLVLYLSLDPDFYMSRSGKYGLPKWLDPSPTIRTSRDYVQEINDREKRVNSSFAKQRQ